MAGVWCSTAALLEGSGGPESAAGSGVEGAGGRLGGCWLPPCDWGAVPGWLPGWAGVLGLGVLAGTWMEGCGWVVAVGWVLGRPVMDTLVAPGVAAVLCLEPHTILWQADR